MRREGVSSMPDPATAPIFPFLTALGGYLTSAVTEFFRDRRTRQRDRETAAATTARERETREVARRVQIAERRSNFQRETLLTLQDAIFELARAAGQMHHVEEMESLKTGRWGQILFPDELDSAHRNASVKTLMLLVRVRDEEVRELAKTFREHANQAVICKTERESQKVLLAMASVMELLHERIGMIVRRLDDDDDAAVVNR